MQKNFPTVGRLIDGAVIEKDIQQGFNERTSLTLSLRQADFTTVSRVADAINSLFYDPIAEAKDGATVDVKVPEAYTGNLVGLVSMIEKLDVKPDLPAKVIINERTGTRDHGRKCAPVNFGHRPW